MSVDFHGENTCTMTNFKLSMISTLACQAVEILTISFLEVVQASSSIPLDESNNSEGRYTEEYLIVGFHVYEIRKQN